MKKILLLISLILVASSQTVVARGGDVAAGMVGGLAAGMIGSAIVNGNSRSSSRAEEQAAAARYETEQLRREQERERIEQVRREVDRRDESRKDEQIRQLSDHIRNIQSQNGSQGSNWMLYLLFGFIFVLSLAVGVLGLILMRRRP